MNITFEESQMSKVYYYKVSPSFVQTLKLRIDLTISGTATSSEKEASSRLNEAISSLEIFYITSDDFGYQASEKDKPNSILY